jgi:hypothetical protein
MLINTWEGEEQRSVGGAFINDPFAFGLLCVLE